MKAHLTKLRVLAWNSSARAVAADAHPFTSVAINASQQDLSYCPGVPVTPTDELGEGVTAWAAAVLALVKDRAGADEAGGECPCKTAGRN